ncbi:hypothetical protein [Azospirillum thermophilum]|uniref:hypothetical protein n=1 Tax=Azospirillum thermophilum TaxID=2202148 RepID=UPI00143D594B|nr:hypothetical protein [Azospirillum thermophilum]
MAQLFGSDWIFRTLSLAAAEPAAKTAAEASNQSDKAFMALPPIVGANRYLQKQWNWMQDSTRSTKYRDFGSVVAVRQSET